MSRFPDFTDPTLFPTFSECPLPDDASTTTTSPIYLLAEIQQNMTLSTSPTFVCIDQTKTSFALTIKLLPASIDPKERGGGYDMKKFKKGYCVLVEGPKKRGVKEGKQGFIEVGVEAVTIIPCSMEKLAVFITRQDQIDNVKEEGKERCQGCGALKDVESVNRCKGCESVWYCGKECQTKGWSQEDHKTECKVLKAVKSVFP